MTRSIPLIIKKEEALLRRLLVNHRNKKEIRDNLRKAWTGFRGEVNLDYHLSFLPEKEYIIFHDVRLNNSERHFQIDTLILTPYFILIIESKNYFGTLFFDQISKQLIRTYQNQENGFSDPIMQVKRQNRNLEMWIKEQRIKSCPIEYLIAIGSPSTIIKTNPGREQIFERVLHAEHVPEKIKELEANYKEKCLSPYLIQKMSQIIRQQQHPQSINIFEKYNIHPSEILQGVICPSCQTPPMIRIHSNWYCRKCKTTSKNAHEEAINDYLFLYNSMTNKQCREFLNIPSINVCTFLLQNMNLPSIGQGKSKIYFPPKK